MMVHALPQSITLARRDIECDLCKRVVTTVGGEIKNDRSEEGIIKGLEDVCSQFPRRDRNKCDAFVEQYANELIHVLIEEESPSTACTMLGVCL